MCQNNNVEWRVRVISFSVQCYLFASNERDTENVWTQIWWLALPKLRYAITRKLASFRNFNWKVDPEVMLSSMSGINIGYFQLFNWPFSEKMILLKWELEKVGSKVGCYAGTRSLMHRQNCFNSLLSCLCLCTYCHLCAWESIKTNLIAQKQRFYGRRPSVVMLLYRAIQRF